MSDDTNGIEGTLEDLVPLLGMEEKFVRNKLRSLLTQKQRRRLAGIFPLNTERRADVLGILAEKGPLNAFQIKKELNIRYSVAHSSCRALENANFIKLLEQKLTEKGVFAKVYGLTLMGLCSVFGHRDSWTDLDDDTVERWKQLDPLILGKWSYFTNKIPKNELAKTFRSATQLVYEWVLIGKDGKRIGDGSEIQDEFRKELFYLGLFLQSSGTRKKWVEAVNSDSELKEWVKAWLEEEMAILKGDLNSMKEILRKIRTA